MGHIRVNLDTQGGSDTTTAGIQDVISQLAPRLRTHVYSHDWSKRWPDPSGYHRHIASWWPEAQALFDSTNRVRSRRHDKDSKGDVVDQIFRSANSKPIPAWPIVIYAGHQRPRFDEAGPGSTGSANRQPPQDNL